MIEIQYNLRFMKQLAPFLDLSILWKSISFC